MSFALRRDTLPQTILAALPFLLFLPAGALYAGVLLFMLALLVSGDYAAKWSAIRNSPLFWPTVGMFTASCVTTVWMDRSADKFWSGFAHYQIYVFLLLFISVGPGEWQRRARNVFIAGALAAASAFYLNRLHLLPDTSLFESYVTYSGNKSILLGILLAIAAGWTFQDVLEENGYRRVGWYVVAFVYLAAALLFFARTRTGGLIFVALCSMALVKYCALSWRKALALFLGCLLILASAWQFSPSLRLRAVETVNDVKAFTRGEATSGGGIRLEMFALTSEMIAEKPLAGHGIGTWAPRYQERAKGLPTGEMTTPHNDYLLYAAELGMLGLAVLCWLWISQLAVALRIGGKRGMQLGMLTVALLIGGMFNAILRDSVFGMAFMVLLAIPLAGVSRRAIQAEWRTKATSSSV
jgi:O-antigen ligase